MRRLLICISVVAVTLATTSAIARLSGADQKKIRRYMGAYLDPADGKERQRNEALRDFNDHFTDRKADQLKEVEVLLELLAHAGERPKHDDGVHRKTVKLDEKGEETAEYVISVPRKYRGSGDAWPLVVCLPDEGQSAEDYLDTYWASEDIRDEYLIAVMDFDYGKIKKVENQQVEDEEGRIKFKQVEVEVPFSWEESQAIGQFWLTLLDAMVKTFHVNPNRVILDGAGMGSSGALQFGAGVSWRFAGLIVRGGAYSGAALENLNHIPVLAYPYATAGEEAEETLKRIESHREDGLDRAGDDDAWGGKDEDGGAKLLDWLNGCVRNRHPVPSTWVATKPSEHFGYWCFIRKRHDREQPARIRIESDRKENKVQITTENVAEFNLYLNDLLVDLDEQFEVWINGEMIGEFQKERSPDQLLAHAFAHEDGSPPNDPGCIFVNELTGIEVAEPSEKDGGANGGEEEEKGGGEK